MESEKPFNPPAFPCEAQGNRSVPPEHDHLQTGIYSSKFPGMTLRDYFAGQALAGLAAHDESNVEWLIEFGAMQAYRLADAMLLERNA